MGAVAQMQNPASPSEASEASTEICRVLGQAVGVASLYGLEHRGSRLALEDAFAALTAYFDAADRLLLTVNEQALLANGLPLDVRIPHHALFLRQLKAWDIASFAILRGLTAGEFRTLVSLLGLPTQAIRRGRSFVQAVSEEGLEHVEVHAAVYRLVADDEVVVSRETSAPAATPQDSPASPLSGTAEQSHAPPAAAGGAGSPSACEVTEAVRRLADQAMRAIAEEDGDRSPEQPALIDAVARAFEDLYPILRRINTKRARLDTRKLGRMLSGLEEELLRRLHAALGSSAPLAAIRSVADRMLKQAQVDRLVEDRDRAQRAWARAEDGLRQVGAADAGGPSAPGTGTQAVPRSPESGTSADHPADPPAPLLERIKYIAALTDLLRQLERWPSTPASARPPLRSILTGINRHLETAAAQGERKVAELEGALRRTPLPAPAEVPSAQRDLEATRMTLLASLAEIGQEILQPLTVLQTSLTILLDGRFGDMDPGQRELVDLCAGAAQRMQRLTNRIVALVGEPSSRQPDGNLLGRLYAPAD